jgi:hypothetical protein
VAAPPSRPRGCAAAIGPESHEWGDEGGRTWFFSFHETIGERFHGWGDDFSSPVKSWVLDGDGQGSNTSRE